MATAHNESRKRLYFINKVAVLYGIPKSTLYYHIRGRVRHGTKYFSFPIFRLHRGTGACRSLDKCSQDWLWESKERGQKDSRRCCQRDKLLRATRISDGWWKIQDLSLHSADSTADIRMNFINKESINQKLFQLIETNNEIKENPEKPMPSQMYNMHEKGMPLSPPTPNIIT